MGRAKRTLILFVHLLRGKKAAKNRELFELTNQGRYEPKAQTQRLPAGVVGADQPRGSG